MATDNLIAKLYESPKTILTVKDVALIWEETNNVNLFSKLKYYTNQGSLIRLTRGVFAKNKEYDSIFVAGPYPMKKEIDDNKIVYRKLKNSVLYNALGVRNEKNCCIATPERAFLDTIYLSPKFYFDNLRSINWEQCFELVKIYDNKQLIKRLNTYQKYAQ